MGEALLFRVGWGPIRPVLQQFHTLLAFNFFSFFLLGLLIEKSIQLYV